MSTPRLLAPLLIRSPSTLQIGAGPDGAVVLDGHPAAALAALLASLDGTRTVTSLAPRANAVGLSGTGWESLVLDLAGRRLVAQGPGVDTRTAHRQGRVRVVGTGSLAAGVVALLATTAVEAIYVAACDLEPPAGAEALVRRIAPELDPGSAAVTAVNHWSKPEHRAVDLTVVASGRAEADRALTTELFRADEPHLVVGATDQLGTVGPYVVPGRAPCLRCWDLTRRDRDPGWPALLRQLGSLPADPTALILRWTVAVAVSETLSAVTSERTTAGAGAVSELTGATGVVTTRRFAAHGACGCHWGRAAEWTHEPGPKP